MKKEWNIILIIPFIRRLIKREKAAIYYLKIKSPLNNLIFIKELLNLC